MKLVTSRGVFSFEIIKENNKTIIVRLENGGYATVHKVKHAHKIIKE